MSPLLQQLGLTPEIIARHVVRIERPLKCLRDPAACRAATRKLRLKYLAQGLTQDGKVRRRSPNGTRKIYVRKKS